MSLTVLYVARQVHYLRDPAVDMILVMTDGRITARGRWVQHTNLIYYFVVIRISSSKP